MPVRFRMSLIPYTTREDTYNYYEERNYVNDVNREHTEVLETYDHDGKARASYLNNQTGDRYNYLTNQSSSVTGLNKDGQAVASSRIISMGQERQAQIRQGIHSPITARILTILGLTIYEQDIMIVREVLS